LQEGSIVLQEGSIELQEGSVELQEGSVAMDSLENSVLWKVLPVAGVRHRIDRSLYGMKITFSAGAGRPLACRDSPCRPCGR